MNILITGAGGFVGRNLNEYWSSRHSVYALRHQDLDLLDATAVADFIKAHPIDLIVHCANEGGSRKTGYDVGENCVISHNIRMFFNLVRCMKPQIRMIHFGSGAEYDRRYYQPKMKETYFDTYPPIDDYGYSKYIISKYIEKYPNITCLRIFGLFGKYEDYRFKFISNAIIKNLLHMPIVINQNVIFDYLYIDDFCRLVDNFLAPGNYQSHYNITPTQSIDLLSIANLINKISDYKSDVSVVHDGMNSEYSGENAELLKIAKDFSFTSYENAIKNLYEYYKTVLYTLDLEIVKADPYQKACLVKYLNSN